MLQTITRDHSLTELVGTGDTVLPSVKLDVPEHDGSSLSIADRKSPQRAIRIGARFTILVAMCHAIGNLTRLDKVRSREWSSLAIGDHIVGYISYISVLMGLLGTMGFRLMKR